MDRTQTANAIFELENLAASPPSAAVLAELDARRREFLGVGPAGQPFAPPVPAAPKAVPPPPAAPARATDADKARFARFMAASGEERKKRNVDGDAFMTLVNEWAGLPGWFSRKKGFAVTESEATGTVLDRVEAGFAAWKSK